MANKYERTDWYVTPYNSSYERYDTQGSAVRYEGPMPLASATFRVAGDEEFELQIKPGTGTGFKGVQEVEPGLYQAKNRKKGAGTGFISLPSTKSVLLAAWWYAKACKAREEGTLGSPSFKTFYTKVRPGHNSPSFLSRMLTCAYQPC